MNDLSRRHFLGLTTGTVLGLALGPAGTGAAAPAPGGNPLALGTACHAFDHLGAYGFQAEAAAACGANIIYASGIGGDAYGGLPPAAEWKQRLDAVRAYTDKAHGLGIPVVLAYQCATSIVGLDNFDKNWPDEFRAKFKTPPAEWLQRDKAGKPLPSWYGGEYRPACMNHPDWRAYQKEMIRFQIETGHGGIFFDNPTVHPEGCYCEHCKAHFESFKKENDGKDAFRIFRTTIARDFLAEMRDFARTLDPNALITANNSTNSPEVLYSQCKLYGYSPFEMSKTEDFVVIEDMGSQPRTTDDGKVFEYGPTYRQLKGLCHGKPLVVCTIAEADYHTPPNLMRLAMAEAAANQATYMIWSTWPEEHRARLSAAARRQVDFLRQHAYTYEGTTPRAQCALYLPMRRWLETDKCRVSEMAQELTRANVHYTVFNEDDFSAFAQTAQMLLAESAKVTSTEGLSLSARKKLPPIYGDQSDWLQRAVAISSDVRILDAPRVRAYVHDAEGACYVHLLNLDVRKRSSFDDEVFPVKDLKVQVQLLPGASSIKSTELLTADDNTTRGPLESKPVEGAYEVTIPLLEVAAILAIKVG